MRRDVMIDLETLGNRPNAAIISIGACKFDPEAGTIHPDLFHVYVDWESAIAHGTVDASTIKWWLDQDDAARSISKVYGMKLGDALARFRKWVGFMPVVWGNGATFDISILTHAYGGDVPWQFRDVRDVRTVVDLADGIVDKDKVPFVGHRHNALDDAVHQAKYVSAMWSALRAGR